MALTFYQEGCPNGLVRLSLFLKVGQDGNIIIVLNGLWSAAWYAWQGGWAWGPRFMVPIIPLLAIPLAFALDVSNANPTSVRRSNWIAKATLLIGICSIVWQGAGILVKDQEIHEIRYNRVAAIEQQHLPPVSIMAWYLLDHKLVIQDEIYHASNFGINDTQIYDLSGVKTFQGLNLWYVHLAREMHKRWIILIILPLLCVAVFSGLQLKNKNN